MMNDDPHYHLSSPGLTPAPVTLEGGAWCRSLMQDPPTVAVTDSQQEPSSADAAFLMLINQLDVDVWTRVTVLKILSVQKMRVTISVQSIN